MLKKIILISYSDKISFVNILKIYKDKKSLVKLG